MKMLKSLIVITVLMFLSACAIYHHYGSYYGIVIDEETQQPLEGAVILADYYTWRWGSPGGPASYFLDTQEVLTDKNGEFKISSLNAYAFRPISTFSSEPGFTIFKPKYKCYTNRLSEDQYETIALRELKTKKERTVSVDECYPTSVPDHKMRALIKLTNIENIDLGFGPRPDRKEK